MFVFRYWEANIAGAPLFPAGIKMLVGSFKDLFGTPGGQRLQAWCRARGWVLTWALGAADDGDDGGGSPEDTTKSTFSRRALDPAVFAATAASHNLSLAADVPAFKRLWASVAHARNASKQPGNNPCPGCRNPGHMPGNLTTATWRTLWEQLPQATALGFLSGSSCADANSCVGVRVISGVCVCNG
jgi:hypothetical protein